MNDVKFEYMGYRQDYNGDEIHHLLIDIGNNLKSKIVVYYGKFGYSMVQLEQKDDIISNELFRQICNKLDKLREETKIEIEKNNKKLNTK